MSKKSHALMGDSTHASDLPLISLNNALEQFENEQRFVCVKGASPTGEQGRKKKEKKRKKDRVKGGQTERDD